MVPASWLCVVSTSSRTPSAGVSGPITANQMNSALGTFLPWSVQLTRESPRPWSVVTISDVLPWYSGIFCSVCQSSARYWSDLWAESR